jgi:hypothetical protein
MAAKFSQVGRRRLRVEIQDGSPDSKCLPVRLVKEKYLSWIESASKVLDFCGNMLPSDF